jgi:hypothetical protein
MSLNTALTVIGLGLGGGFFVIQQAQVPVPPWLLIALAIGSVVSLLSPVVAGARPIARAIRRLRFRTPLHLARDEQLIAAAGMKALAYPRGLSMIYQDEHVLVHCVVAICGLSDTDESPTELIVRPAHNRERQICVLKIRGAPQKIGTGEWRFINYSASISIEQRRTLQRAIRDTMQPISLLPLHGPVFLEVIIDLPEGHALQSHMTSGVQYEVPIHIGGLPSTIVKIANWDGVPIAWAFDAIMALSESDKATLRKTDRPGWQKFLDEARRRGLTYPRPESVYKIVLTDGTIREFSYDDVSDLPHDEMLRLFDATPGLKEWWERETSDRMGPVGRPGAPWPDDLDDSSWVYREMDGRTWRYRDICALPIREREKLKREKIDVWNAYWSEALRREPYVLPNGRRLSRAQISAMGTVELIQLGQEDPDAINWHMHRQRF